MTPSDRKAQILEAAQELIQTQGYAGFSYQDLSSRLGIAKPSIHHHFPTKEALGLALIESYGRMLDGLENELKAVESPADQLRALLRFGEQDAAQHEHSICPGSTLHANFEVFPESMQKATVELTARMHTWLTDLLRRGRECGEIRFEGEPEAQAWLLEAVMQGGRLQARTHGMHVWSAVVDQIEGSLLTSARPV